MAITRTILTVTIGLLSASAWAVAAAATVPITFARSGQAELVEVAVAKGKPTAESVVLAAFGRVWNKPAQVKNGVAKIKVPIVRVPTVFQIISAGEAKSVLGELVAYPDQAVKWDKKIILYSADAPKWFNQWAGATGLPIKKVNLTEFKAVNQQKPNDKKHLLIIGRKTAGKDFWDTLAIAVKYKINILVLDADWFGDKSGKVAVQPKQMAGGLAELRKQKWSKPLTFGSHRKPWPRITNRWVWIDGKEGLPLVEEIGGPTTSYRRIVLSYTPWQKQLGRREEADMTLLKVLAATVGKNREFHHWFLPKVLYPPTKILTKTPTRRPVLTLGYKTWTTTWSVGFGRHIIDLRGKDSPPAGFRKTLKWVEDHNDREGPLLILGDDPLLDNWKWAKIDRKKKMFKQAGVFWLPDDTLPPSAKNQIRLMLKLTELGAPLRNFKWEKENENAN